MDANLTDNALVMADRLRAMAGPIKPNVLEQAAELLERIAARLANCTNSHGEP